MDDLGPMANIEAEQCAIGSMMLEADALAIGVELLRRTDFYRPVHEEIFDALMSLAERNEPVDLITLQEELRNRGKLADCGGTEYLMSLANSVPTASNIEHYASIVIQKSTLRLHQSINVQYAARCSQADADPTQVALWLSTQLESLESRNGHKPINLSRLEDILVGEIQPVEWIVNQIIPRHGITMLTGDSGVGKSWIVIALAYAVAGGVNFLNRFGVTPTNVLICDVEHDEAEAARRMRRVYEGFVVTNRAFPSNSPIAIHAEAFKLDTPADMSAYTRLIQSEHAGLVICDPFIHSLPPGADENSSSDVARFFEKVRKLQQATGAAFVFVHHTRKQSPHSPNTAGQMLRGSSAIKGVLDSHLFARQLKHGPILVEHEKSRKGRPVDDFAIIIEDRDTATVIEYAGETHELTDQIGVSAAVIERLLSDNQAPMFKEEIMEYAQKEGLSQATVRRCLDSGVKSGTITRTKVGRRAKYAASINQQAMWEDDEND